MLIVHVQLQQGTLSMIHLDHFKYEDSEIPPFGLQLLISVSLTRHSKSARPKVVQEDGSGESRVDHMTYRERSIGYRYGLIWCPGYRCHQIYSSSWTEWEIFKVHPGIVERPLSTTNVRKFEPFSKVRTCAE